MTVRLLALAALAATLTFAAPFGVAQDLPRHRHPGYYTARTVYGYRPYTPWVGPIKARHELDPYVFSPRTPGVDYSWGVDYFFGHGPGDRAYQGAPQR